jgi:hypothetical protein
MLFRLTLSLSLLAGLLYFNSSVADANPDLVLFQNADASPVGRIELLGDTRVRLLNDANDGRRVVVADLTGGWSRQLPSDREQTVEALVLEGEITWQGTTLGPYDYAHLPARAPAPVLTAGRDGARLLLFLDPPRDSDGAALTLVDSDRLPWQPATVAVRDMGRELALELKDLRYVEETGQRSWLLRVFTDFEIPWEVHTSAEEGFLLDGEFRNGECLPAGPVDGLYRPGGYFYRPAGIAHGGPESGTETGALWILRTPTDLTVEFLDDCG